MDRIYESARETNAFNLYAEYTYTENGEIIDVREICLNGMSMFEALQDYDGRMTKIQFFRKPIRFFDDIQLEGDKQDFGQPIYFGKKMSALEYNTLYDDKKDISLDNYVIVCDNGEVLTEFEADSLGLDEVLNTLRRLEGYETSRKLN